MMLMVRPRLTALARRIAHRLRDLWRGDSAKTLFDIHNPRVLFPLLQAHGAAIPQFDLHAVQDARSAALTLIGLRMHHQCRLSDGLDGLNVPIPLTVTAYLRGAFDAHLSQRVHRVFELRHDLRDVFPLGLTPAGRGAFLEWLIVHGRRDFGLRDEEILWWLFEVDEDPTRGLAATWSLQPRWQAAVPNALTPAGWPRLKAWVAREYGLRSRWLRQASLSTTAPIDPDAGVNVLAHFRYPSGLQEAAVAVVNALSLHGIPTARRDLPVRFACDWRDLERYHAVETCNTSIVCAAVNTFFDKFLPESGLHLRPGVRRIAIWYWELEQLPAEWVERIERTALVDEIWAPTRFIADALRNALRIPVVPMLPGIEVPPFALRPRSHFGLPRDKFTFLFMFDMNSAMPRKNPLGLIDAYRRAFPNREAHLVIKVSRADSDPANRDRLIDACRAHGVQLIDEVLPREDVLALLASCDAYVSLHRSEGLGLTLAEAMLLGKPAIGTGYSGNLDFMTPETSYLVNYQRVPIAEDMFAYPRGCYWADPDLDHAAHWMRHVYDHRDEAIARGRAGQAWLRDHLSLHAAGERMVARLCELRGQSKA